MSEGRIVYSTDLTGLIKAALQKGLSTQTIVTALSHGRIYSEVKAIAEKHAATLGLRPVDFIRMAGKRS